MKFHLYLLFFFFLSCNGKVGQQKDVMDEVVKLNNTEYQSAYLEDIYNIDQKVRLDSQKDVNNYGFDSEEVKKSSQKMRDTDALNFMKIEAYLSVHGHPDKNQHSENAVRTPWIVLHHAMGGLKPRRDNFHYLYEAYKKGDLEDSDITFFLHRAYSIKYNQRINWEGPFTTQDEFDTLFSSLDLLPITSALDKKYDEAK